MKGQKRTVFVVQSKEARGWTDFDLSCDGYSTLAVAQAWLDYYIRAYDNGTFRIVKRLEEVMSNDAYSRNLNENPEPPTGK